MKLFSTRPVTLVTIPISENRPILKVEQVVIRFENRSTIDIGALCYLQRETVSSSGRRRSTEGRKVSLSSLCKVRIGHIRSFLTYISNEVLLGQRRTTTIQGYCSLFSVFLAWADANGHSKALENVVETRRSVVAYAAYIRQRVASNAISLNSGVALQKQTFKLLSEFLEIDNLTRGINLLFGNSHSVKHTEAPSEAEQTRVLILCEALFNGLTELVLEAKPFPFGVSVPSHLGYPQNIMWVFPTKVWCLPVSRLALFSTSSHGAGYNYREGRLSTRAQVMDLEKYRQKNLSKNAVRKNVSQMLRNSQNLLAAANIDPNHSQRQHMGMMALNAFIPMFLSRTGMNWSQVVNLTWDFKEADAISVVRQKFRTIKFRAGGKVVHYQLPLSFMPLFKKFLKLREYLLQNEPEFNQLFFTMGRCATKKPSPLKTALTVTYLMLQRIDPVISPVLSRAWRSAKINWLIPRTDLATASNILQNSEAVARRSYVAGSTETNFTEMSNFLDAMIVGKGVSLKGAEVGAIGNCVSYGHPHEIHNSVMTIKPNCREPEVGCLFCDKFKVHVDEIDIRKLLSCRYCLTRGSHLAGFHRVSMALIQRIDLIINDIRNRDDLLVTRISDEVEEGGLDPYWASKYDMLLRLRLINDIE